MTANDDSEHELIDELADEFLSACLRGAEPKVDDYCQAYPWLEKDIRQLFPMLKFLESNKLERESFEPPDSVGPYRIDREIGRGGMAIVYEATDQSESVVALKLLMPNRPTDEAVSASRFEREAETVSRLDHPGIVRVIDFGKEGKLAYLAMQLIEGSSIDRVVRLIASARRSRPENWLKPVMRQVAPEEDFSDIAGYYRWVVDVGKRMAMALQHSHDLGILHRDLKPSNVLVDKAGKAWLTDFGLAKIADSKLTRTGQIIGTLRYLAPERFRGHCDHRADIYGLGMVLYELLAFRPAFAEEDRLRLIERIDESRPEPPRQIVSDVPLGLQDVVLRAMAKDVETRYQSAREFANALEASDLEGSVHQSGSPLKRFRGWFQRSR